MKIRTSTHSYHGRPSPKRAGFSLMEVLIAGAVVSIAVVGAIGSMGSTAQLGKANDETTRAYQAGRQMVEEILAADASQVLALYNAAKGDDPGGAGTAPGPNFVVFGLDARPDDGDGQVGCVLFPTDSASPAVLRENYVDPSFGMPRDLTADNKIDGADHAADYFVLPVRVRLEWKGASGNRTLEIDTLVSAR